MLKQVFISYRHESPEHARAVRRLGERLQREGIPVALDQFFLESYPGGPDVGWAKWAEEALTRSDCVLVVGSPGWFAAFEHGAEPGSGLGAAFEGSYVRQRLYDQGRHDQSLRLVFVDSPLVPAEIPIALRAWHVFRPLDSEDDFRRLLSWVSQRLGLDRALPAVRWPAPIEFPKAFVGRLSEWKLIEELLAGQSHERILLIDGGAGLGKSTLVRHAARYADRLGMAHALVDFKARLDVIEIWEVLSRDLADILPSVAGISSPNSLRGALRALERPVLLLFDGYEGALESTQEFLSGVLNEVMNAPGLAVILAGQTLPDRSIAPWRDLSRQIRLEPIKRTEDWTTWLRARHPAFADEQISLPTLLLATGGNPKLTAEFLDVISTSGFLAEGNPERYQRDLAIRAKKGFERNRERGLRVASLSTQSLPFFGALGWQLEPHVNVLLGRNGYGKSHLLRLVAALLARDGASLVGYFGSTEGQLIRMGLTDPSQPDIEMGAAPLER